MTIIHNTYKYMLYIDGNNLRYIYSLSKEFYAFKYA